MQHRLLALGYLKRLIERMPSSFLAAHTHQHIGKQTIAGPDGQVFPAPLPWRPAGPELVGCHHVENLAAQSRGETFWLGTKAKGQIRYH